MAEYEYKYKFPDDSYELALPVKIHNVMKDGKSEWQLIDANDMIVASSLTKELAETFVQAVNFFSDALTFVKAFVEWERVMGYAEDAEYIDIVQRTAMYSQALAFLVELGVIKSPDKGNQKTAFEMWRKQLMEDFHEKANK